MESLLADCVERFIAQSREVEQDQDAEDKYW